MFAVLFAMLAAASAETQPACNVDSPIVVENARPGSPSTEWDVNGAGSPEVQGFATRASLLPGATVRFKIKTQYAEPLRVDIYRLGYYNGDGARKVGQATIVNAQAAARQPACVSTEPKAELVDCGNWAVVALYALPADAVTGLYFARAVLPSADPDKKAWRADASRIKTDRLHAVEGADPRAAPAAGPHKYGAAGRNRLRNALREPRASHIWFTVRASGDGPRGLLFQSSDQTWHAYAEIIVHSVGDSVGPVARRSKLGDTISEIPSRRGSAESLGEVDSFALARQVQRLGRVHDLRHLRVPV